MLFAGDGWGKTHPTNVLGTVRKAWTNSSCTANRRAETARKFGGERQWDKRWVACPEGMGRAKRMR